MPIHVKQVERIDSPDDPAFVRIAAEVEFRRETTERHTFWYEARREYADSLSPTGNPWLLAMAVMAAERGEALQVDTPVDSRLYEHVHRLVRIWYKWGWAPQPVIPIEADVKDNSQPGEVIDRTGAFFSGGIDSLFTLLTDNAEYYPERSYQIDELIHIWGLNETEDNRAAFEQGRAAREEVAEATGKRLITVRTNLRAFMRRRETWVWMHHMFIGAVGLALEPRYRRILLASDRDYSKPQLSALNPLQTPLFSTNRLKFIHDGATHHRLDKLTVIAGSDLVARTLRVCNEAPVGVLNCGRCVKCLRTMAALDLLGRLDQFPVFDRSHYPAAFKTATAYATDEYDLNWLLASARDRQRRDLAPLIAGMLRLYQRRTTTRRVRLERFLSEWLLPSKAAGLIGRAADRAYVVLRKR